MELVDLERKLGIEGLSDADKLEIVSSIQQSVNERRLEQKKQDVAQHTKLVIQAIRKIESDLKDRFDEMNGQVKDKVASLKDGPAGRDGKDGKPGRDGKDGLSVKGDRGLDGKNGQDGQDGVSVVDAKIDFDGSLVIKLSSGREINAGEVVPFDIADKIKVITNGGGTSQSVLDSIASLQAQINAISNSVVSVASADGSVTVTNISGAVDLSVAVAASTTNVICQVRNTTGATLTKGTVVYMSGATGQIPTVSKAIATGDSTSAQTLGLINADLPNNSNGYVTVIGIVNDIDTSAFTDGAQLYLSGTTAGTYTSTKTYAPTHLVYVGVVEYAHAVHGKIFVKVQNGYELDEIHNVSAQSPTTGQTIVYNSSTQLWEKNTVSLTAGVNGTLPIANGGTNATTASGARTNLGSAASGANTDITSVALTTGSVSTAPSADTDIANKLYVDTYVQGIDAKAACRVASTANVAAITGLLTVDGITLSIGDRVLLKNQTTSSQNGIYVVSAVAWTRALDLDVWPEAPGAFTFIEQGTVNSGTGWVTTVTPGGTINVTAMPWSQFSGVGTYTAGTGLSLTGSQFAIDSTVATLTGSQTLTNKTLTSPTLTTPALGTPASGTLTNCTFPTLNQNTTGSAGSLATTNFTIVQSGTKLLFKYGATTIASMDSTGVITSAVNIVANGTP